MLQDVLASLEDAKAEDTVAIDLAGKTSLADAMIVTSGRSNRHVGAIADQLIEKLKAEGHTGLRVEGMPHCDWVLIDAGDVIVHICVLMLVCVQYSMISLLVRYMCA